MYLHSSDEPTDAELSEWLVYIENPEMWKRIPLWKRLLAGEMSKGRDRTYTRIAALVAVYFVVRTLLLVAGVPISPVDLVVVLVIGVVIGVLLMSG